MTEISINPQSRVQISAVKNGNGASGSVGRANSTPEDERQRLAKACSEFEAIFVEQLFKTMRASVPETGLMRGGRAEEIYTGMLDQQIAVEMSRGQGSIGLASHMLSRLRRDHSFEG